MASIYDVDPNELIEKAGSELKKLGLKKPVWADFVKTGHHKEKQPTNEDWWYVRLAAILRNIYKLGPIGTSKLRRKYGGRKNRGHKPDKVFKGSGSVIRKALQQLEDSGFVEKAEKGTHKGRIITKKGRSFLDKIASQIYKPTGKTKFVFKKEVKVKKEKKVKEKKIEKETKVEEKKVEKKEEPKKEVKEEKIEKETKVEEKKVEKKEESKKEIKEKKIETKKEKKEVKVEEIKEIIKEQPKEVMKEEPKDVVKKEKQPVVEKKDNVPVEKKKEELIVKKENGKA